MKNYILELAGSPRYYTQDNEFSGNLDDAKLFKTIDEAMTEKTRLSQACIIHEVEVTVKLGYPVRE